MTALARVAGGIGSTAASDTFAPGPAPLGTAATDATRAYSVSLADIGSAPAVIEARFAGDATRYPARATITR